MTVGQLEGLISPATPVAVLLVVGLLVIGYFVSRRLIRAIGRVATGVGDTDKRLSNSIAKIGARVGRLERDRDLDRVRRYQLEYCLRARGIDLPPWPDDEDEDQDQVADLDTAHMETQYFVPARPSPRRTS